jgi:hypothetical protein
MKTAHGGLIAFCGFSLVWMGTAVLLWGGTSAPLPLGSKRGDSAAPASAAFAPARDKSVPFVAPSEEVTDARLESLAHRFVELLGETDVRDDDELARLERALLDAGEQAAGPLVAQIRREQDPARRSLLLDFLRKVPGPVAEAYFIEQARAGVQGSSRTLAIDALADRRSDTAFAALDQIAKTDPELPNRPFLVAPRQANDDSTELPDEVTFTPRMKAMAALAATQDTRATPLLSDILQNQADESLRMEAARDLAQLRSDPVALDALLHCLGSDGSAYVRLAALHSLEGVADARLWPILTQITERDPDLGVQALARRLLNRLATEP